MVKAAVQRALCVWWPFRAAKVVEWSVEDGLLGLLEKIRGDLGLLRVHRLPYLWTKLPPLACLAVLAVLRST